MKVRAIIQRLSALGCQPIRTKGSHQTWRTPKGNSVPIVVNHMNSDVTGNVLASVRRVLRAEGLDLEAA